MNSNTISKLLSIVNEMKERPLCQLFQKFDTDIPFQKGGHTFQLSNFISFDKIIQKLNSNQYNNKEEWYDDMKKAIYPHWELQNLTKEETDLCKKLNRELNHMLEKHVAGLGLLPSTKWGDIIFNFQDTLQCVVADSPKVFQIPNRLIVRKPKVPSLPIRGYEDLTKAIAKYPQEKIPEILEIIKNNEPDIKINDNGENTIELMDLKVNTIREIRKHLNKFFKKRHNEK
ncbi:hypothetical protein TVAG_284070 [Trichomonas vaginalis G3]|uniref:NET domain-containing protein n=1 Tax=Trichomonas vaginalis (strain ATCC PRA-98 / G3) TaxID=412133 RepID=A2FF70_TRIV3|nr:uncharacterized protein TVAGG3_1078260 [Trichomonas vaginalis G3]EAX96437.1 hypothetical protein TVAG_284070 [Trichomonas vaginalis G3]KAI5482828.1 hypothetical protein TVAGG3_1078260 [Trichomonas vaginalis G3]|eukprot:XP_001309367.1 hypothetical protein [Trichomonas vaginalis G3]